MVLIILAVLGLCFGSFINALVWRLHKQTEGKDSKYSILKGRSICPNCQHILGPNDLIPVISWLWLKGKCAYCSKPISPQYPLVELFTAGLFMLSYLAWPFIWTTTSVVLFLIWLPILVILIALIIYDLKWMLLPNRLVFPLIGLTSAFVFIRLISGEVALGQSFLLLALSIIVIAGLFEGLYIVSAGKWIGGGDVKLAVAIGLIIMQPDNVLLVLFLASLAGTIVALPSYLKTNKKGAKIPFGPHLILATIATFLWGDIITNWLFNQLLINGF